MARKQETGIAYFPLNTDTVTHDKIKLLIIDHGHQAFFTWICIVSEAYRKNGYFFDTKDPDRLQIFASDVCKCDLDHLQKVISACLKRSIFCLKTYKSSGVLTSRRMQETYLEAIKRRKLPFGISPELDLTKDDSERSQGISGRESDQGSSSKIHLSDINSESVDINHENVNTNVKNDDISTQSKVNKSKVNKSKVSTLQTVDILIEDDDRMKVDSLFSHITSIFKEAGCDDPDQVEKFIQFNTAEKLNKMKETRLKEISTAWISRINPQRKKSSMKTAVQTGRNYRSFRKGSHE